MVDNAFKNKGYDEIDLIELIKILWKNKKKIFYITFASAIISVFYSLSLPNIYKAEALLAPASEDDSGGGFSRMAGQLGGLASIAGFSLPDGGVSKTELGIEVLKSRKFVRDFVKRHKIVPQLLAAEGWNNNTRKLTLDSSEYNEETKSWPKRDEPPTNEEIYGTFSKSLILQEDAASEFIILGFRHISPDLAAKWTELIIKDLNNAIRKQDIEEAESSIAFLRQQIEASPLSDLQTLFYNLIQSQTEKMMLANVREEYVFKTIDPATVPEKKSEPKRALICILGTFLGGVLSLIFVFFTHYILPQKNKIQE